MTDRIIEDDEAIILIDDEGGEHEFYLIDTIELGEARYAILLPAEDEEEEESEVIILKIGEDEEGNEVFYEIEDDDEWEKVADAWEEAETEDEDSALADLDLSELVPVVITEAMVKENCPYCRIPLKAGTKAIACPVCKTFHHEECWRESRGCANPSCK